MAAGAPAARVRGSRLTIGGRGSLSGTKARQNAVLARHRATWGRPTYGECGAISGLLFLAKRSFSASASKF